MLNWDALFQDRALSPSLGADLRERPSQGERRRNSAIAFPQVALAAAHAHAGYGPLLAAAAVIAGVLFLRWLARLIWAPLGTCWLCKGTGKRPWSTSRRYGRCFLCKGKPERFVAGARLVNREARKKARR